MTYWTLWTNPARTRDWLVGLVARLPARVQTKLLTAFLTIAGLLIVLGAVGIQVLNGVNGRTDDLIKLQRKIAAFNQVQHDTTNQLYAISTALLLQDDRMLDAALRQLSQFGYDLDRMEFVAEGEAEVLANVRKDYDRMTQTVTRTVDMIRAGRTAEAREIQTTEIVPLADRLERQTNQLVNIAEADMVAAIDATSRTYRISRIIVVAFALGSLALALGLGYVISWSLVAPVREIESKLRRIAAGDFGHRIEVVNRDELGELASKVNQTSQKLGKLYDEIETHRRDLAESLQRQTATAEVLQVISRSTFDLPTVLDTLVGSAAKLCNAIYGGIFLRDGDRLVCGALYGGQREDVAHFQPMSSDRSTASGRVMISGRTEIVGDVFADADYDPRWLKDTWTETRAIMSVPLLRDGKVEGVFTLCRPDINSFTAHHCALVQTFADQAVIAIENVRLFDEVRARTRELQESLDYQTATSDVLNVISRSPTDVQPVFDMIARSAATLCEAQFCFVYRYDGKLLHFVAQHGVSEESTRIVRNTFPLVPTRGSAAERAIVDLEVSQIPDLTKDPEFMHRAAAAFSGLCSAVAVPMLRDGQPIGSIAVGRAETGLLPSKQVELLKTFADQAVIAIENVRLFDEVQARTRELARSVGELKALGEVSQAVNSTLDLNTVLDTIVTKAVQLSGTDAGAIYVYSKSTETFRLRATYGMSEQLIVAVSAQTVGLHDVGIGEAARSRAPVQMPDLGQCIVLPVHRIVNEAGYRSLLSVPLLLPNKIVGALVVWRKLPGEFAESTVHLMQTFGAQSVLAIQNARLFSEIEENSRQLEIASRHKSQFLANMSHELRTPLNSVLGFSEMLADGLYGPLPEKAVTTLGRIQANGKHLLGLINDVLDLSKIEAGQLQLMIDSYSPAQIVKAAAAVAEPLARAKNLTLNIVIADGMPPGRGDERRLTQVLLNLAGNAVKFTDRGSVEIGAHAVNGSFEFVVRDTGSGIAPEFQSRIFEEFQQVDDSSTRKKGGTGLGLAISKRIVEMHGGTIGVESALGAGSKFKVRIPIAAQQKAEAI